MNTTELKGTWNEQKAKLKQKFAVLTDNDLMFEDGKKEEMFGKLQIKLGKTKKNCTRFFQRFNHLLIPKKPVIYFNFLTK